MSQIEWPEVTETELVANRLETYRLVRRELGGTADASDVLELARFLTGDI